VIGFFFTLSTSAFSVLTVRTLQGATNTAPPVKSSTSSSASTSVSSTSSSSTAAPYSPQLVHFLYTAVPIAAAISILATKLNHPFAQPLNTLFMALTTVTGFVWGACLPVRSYLTNIILSDISFTDFFLITIGASDKNRPSSCFKYCHHITHDIHKRNRIGKVFY